MDSFIFHLGTDLRILDWSCFRLIFTSPSICCLDSISASLRKFKLCSFEANAFSSFGSDITGLPLFKRISALLFVISTARFSVEGSSYSTASSCLSASFLTSEASSSASTTYFLKNLNHESIC